MNDMILQDSLRIFCKGLRYMDCSKFSFRLIVHQISLRKVWRIRSSESYSNYTQLLSYMLNKCLYDSTLRNTNCTTKDFTYNWIRPRELNVSIIQELIYITMLHCNYDYMSNCGPSYEQDLSTFYILTLFQDTSAKTTDLYSSACFGFWRSPAAHSAHLTS